MTLRRARSTSTSVTCGEKSARNVSPRWSASVTVTIRHEWRALRSAHADRRMIVTLFIVTAMVALLLTFSLARTRGDIRRLTLRVADSDPKAVASLDVDSFGDLDELAGGVYRLRSDLTRALAAADRQNALLHQIMNGLGEGVVAIDRQRRIVLANRRFVELFALHGDLVGRPIGEIVRNSALFAAFDRALDHTASSERFEAGGRKVEMGAPPLPSHRDRAVGLFIGVNPARALRGGGRQVKRAGRQTVDVGLATTRDAAVVRVTDHGDGVPSEEKERIFHRFYRVDKSRSQEVAGTGLGLAITKHLIILHGGSIELESERGKGATFVVKLPR